MTEGVFPKPNGGILYASEANDFYYGIVPVGAILPWLKNHVSQETGSATSTTADKLIDSGATFVTNGVTAGTSQVMISSYSDANENTTITTAYSLEKTITIGEDGVFGHCITKVDNEIKAQFTNRTTTCKVTFYYTDSTSADSSEQSITGTTSYTAKEYLNPNTHKLVWKIEVYLKSSNGDSTASERNDILTMRSFVAIVSVDSETQLTLADDYIKLTGISYTVYNIPTLVETFVECNGQTLSDVESIYNGLVIPNLNGGSNKILRGAFSSGGTGGSDTHTHTITTVGVQTGGSNYGVQTNGINSSSSLPAYYEIVYIMKVK